MRREVFDLRKVADDAVESTSPLIEKRRQQLLTEFPEKPVYVEGDRARLQQIQVNLLTNASKYSPDGGRIELSLSTEESCAVIRVRDQGIGISQKEQGLIFDLFVQSQATAGRADGGLGVGLTLVRSIVEKHEGTVTVHSEGAGEGSTFIIRLPLTEKRPTKQRTQKSHRPKCSGLKILIVEDNPDGRNTLAELLQLDGYEVVTATDGIEGLEAIERENPHVALVDIGLPEMNGLDLARQVRAKSLHDLCLIALTGYGQRRDREAVREAGFDAHIVKPLDMDELAKLLEEKALEIQRDKRS